MKLAKIEITNFRCFESFALELRPDINVIVGVNGAGKTTILDSIATALYDVVAANGGGGKRQRGWQKANLQPSDIHIPPGSTSAAVGRKDFVQFKAATRDFYEVPGFPNKTQGGDPAFLEWTDHIKYLPPSGFSYDTSQSERLSSVYQYFAAVWQELRKTDTAALIPLPVVAYYRASRRLTEMPKMGNVFELELSREGAFHQALNAGADFQAMCQWFYLRENAELREKVQIRHDPNYQFPELKAAREALLRHLEGAKRVFFDENPPSLKVAFDRPGQGDETLELSQLSDGYRNLLGLVLDFARRLAQAHPNWPNPLEAPGILLIDEIELHLHPKWQQTIVPDLHAVFPNTQIIATTHSPYVVTTVESRCVHIAENASVRPCPTPTYGAKVSDVVAAVMGVPNQRPPDNPIADQVAAMFEAIDHGQAHAAREFWSKLQEWAKGFPEPDLVRADLMIRRLEVNANGKVAAKP
jgi:predicted ATP-binding protein involved in virulence